MKTLEETKDLIAVKHGYKNWKDVSTYAKSLLVDEVATEYAWQMCDLQKHHCAYEVANDEFNLPEQSILNTPNVVTTK